MAAAERQAGGYSVEQVAQLLGISVAEVRRCVRAGFLSTEQLPSGEVRLCFQDLVTLRKAAALISARIAPHRVRRALSQLHAEVPGRPLSGVQLRAEGKRLVVQEGDSSWNVESRQLLMRFSPGPVRSASVQSLPPEPALDAQGWYQVACELEQTSLAEAEKAYRRALGETGGHADAHINLGRLLHGRGELSGAREQFEAALRARPEDATARFNLGVTLEDLGLSDAAVLAYQHALEADPRCADAYFNLARLHERLGDRAAALRCLRAYRKLLQER